MVPEKSVILTNISQTQKTSCLQRFRISFKLLCSMKTRLSMSSPLFQLFVSHWYFDGSAMSVFLVSAIFPILAQMAPSNSPSFFVILKRATRQITFLHFPLQNFAEKANRDSLITSQLMFSLVGWRKLLCDIYIRDKN